MPDSMPMLTDEVIKTLRLHGIYGFNGSEVACRCSRSNWRHVLDWHAHVADALAPLIARMVADAEQRGRAEVSMAVEAVLGPVARGGYVSGRRGGKTFLGQFVNELRAALTDPDAAVARIKAEAWNEGYAAADFAVHRGVANPCAVLDRGNPYRADRIGGDA